MAYFCSMKTALFSFALIFLFACSGGSGEKSKREPMGGQQVYTMYCTACHGADGTMGFSGATNLKTSVLPLEDRIKIVTHGKNIMNAFKGVLTKEEIESVSVYVESLRQ
jgi:cytochrome c6